jgi:phage head maturation protease
MTTDIEERADNPKPYGDVAYADPQNGKYPIDTEAHARAAWSYINMPKNQEAYSAEQLALVKGRIKAACKKFGINVEEDSAPSQRAEDNPEDPVRGTVEERAAALDAVDFAERIISVIAVPYEQPTPVEYRGERWREVFTRGAFKGIETHKRSIPVASVLRAPAFDHVDGHLVGKVSDVFPNHSDGLRLDTRISDTPAGDETLKLASDGVLHPSVGFVARGGDHRLDRVTMTRRVNRAFLDHLSFVPTPAYSGAKVIGVRAAAPEVLTERMSPAVTPGLDEFFSDPLFQWADERRSKR